MRKSSIIFSIVLTLLLILVVMGMIRFSIHQQSIIGYITCDSEYPYACDIEWGKFVLPSTEIIARLQSANLEKPFLEFGEYVNSYGFNTAYSVTQITDIVTFFVAVGNFLQAFAIPVRFFMALFETIGGFFGWFFGLFIMP